MQKLKLIIRGIKIVYIICPSFFVWSIIFGLTQAITPYFSLYMSAVMVNELVYTREPKRLLIAALITLVGVFVLNNLRTFVQRKNDVWRSTFFVNKGIFFLNYQNSLEYAYLEDSRVNQLYQQIRADESSMGGGLTKIMFTFPSIISNVSDIIFSAAMTVSMLTAKGDDSLLNLPFAVSSKPVAIVIALLLPVSILVSINIQRSQNEKISKAMNSLVKSNMVLQAYTDAVTLDVPIFNMKSAILEEMKRYTHNPDYILITEKIRIKYSILSRCLNALMNLLLFIFVAAKAYTNAFGIGNFLMYRRSTFKFIEGISGLMSNVGALLNNNMFLKRVFEYLDLPKTMHAGKLLLDKKSSMEIEFKNVSFKYPNCEDYAIKNVSLSFRTGDKLAIVGMNGSGKSTFIKLLCRMYDVTEGEILLNGVNIKEYDYEDYLDCFSAVFQDFMTFSFSIAENVSAELDYDEAKVRDCLIKAGLSERLDTLPKGFETYLFKQYDNEGIELSGGEIQKLALARALYKEAPFIMLDEPTASLDPVAEADIYERFNEIVGERTAIYISHRLSSCRFCRNIFVFDNGSLVQEGSHAELLKNTEGKYFELWNAQAQYYV